MSKYKETVDRTDGNGLKIPKFHQMLHMRHYILRYGPPLNYHSGPGEKNANVLAKQQANWTSRNLSTFEQEVGKRLSEHIVIDSNIRNHIPEFSKNIPKDNLSIGGTRFKVVLSPPDDQDDVQPILLVERRRKKNAPNQMTLFNMDVLDFLWKTLMDFVPHGEIMCFSEHKRNGLIFRSHPSYCSGISWHDWAMFKWTVNNQVKEIPGEILCFVDLRDMVSEPQITGYDDKGEEILSPPPCEPGIYAVVNSLVDVPSHLETSVLLLEGTWETKRNGKLLHRLMDVETISDNTFVFPNFGMEHHNKVYVVSKRESWSMEF